MIRVKADHSRNLISRTTIWLLKVQGFVQIDPRSVYEESPRFSPNYQRVFSGPRPVSLLSLDRSAASKLCSRDEHRRCNPSCDRDSPGVVTSLGCWRFKSDGN